MSTKGIEGKNSAGSRLVPRLFHFILLNIYYYLTVKVTVRVTVTVTVTHGIPAEFPLEIPWKFRRLSVEIPWKFHGQSPQ